MVSGTIDVFTQYKLPLKNEDHSIWFTVWHETKTSIIPKRGTAGNQLQQKICSKDIATSLASKNERQQRNSAHSMYKECQDKATSQHNIKIGEKVLINNHFFKVAIPK